MWLYDHLNVNPSLFSHSFKVKIIKVINEECIFDGFEDNPDVLCVRGTGEVCVKGFMALSVLILVHL